MSADFTFRRNSRNWPTLITVIGVWTLLLLAWLLIDAAPWVLGLFALFTVPALFDLWTNPQATLTLTDGTLSWSMPRAEADITLAQIDHVRLDTRLDLSVRATVVLHAGPKLRIPYTATPPHQAFEDALNARGITTKRPHFGFIQ